MVSVVCVAPPPERSRSVRRRAAEPRRTGTLIVRERVPTAKRRRPTVRVAATVLAVRAPGLTLKRTPLFSWSMLVAAVVWSLTLPVLAALMVLAWVDLRQGQRFLGGPGGIYDRIAWVFWQPTLYAFAIPALGISGLRVVPYRG